MELRTNFDETDEKLFHFISSNDEVKDYLLEKYTPMIYKEINKVRKIAYILDVDFADLTQEAMLAFTNALNHYKGEEEVKFGTFATVCVRRKLVSYIKKFDTGKRYAEKNAYALEWEYPESDETLLTMLRESSSREPLNRIITDESLHEVSKRFKEKLSQNETIALVLSTEGISTSEIAEFLDVSPKQVYNLLYRARQKLKND